MSVVVVTGTDTGVGKTVACAALAVRYAERGSVVVVKPTQTGTRTGEPTDVQEVARLAACPTEEWTALPEPLSPEAAARVAGVALPPVTSYVERVRALAERYDTVLVEGAGGLLVRLDAEGGTLLDLAVAVPAEVVVVARAGLGTLNHAELTVAACRGRGVEVQGVVIGAWPGQPELVERLNAEDLPRLTGVRLLGRLPAGAGAWTGERFRAAAPTWFS